MGGILKQIAMTTLRWTAGWSVMGILVGIGLMVAKVEPIAESGVKPGNMSAFSFWVVLCWGAGSIFGLLVGFVFASLMALTGKLETGRHKLEQETKNTPAAWGWRLACGTIAGSLVMWWIWLATHTDTRLISWEGAGLGAALGLASATVSGITAQMMKRLQVSH